MTKRLARDNAVYRLATFIAAMAWVSLAASLTFRPPATGATTALTPFDLIVDSESAAAIFLVVGIGVGLLALFAPAFCYVGHSFLFVMSACYGFASYAAAAVGHGGFQVGSLCLALLATHGLCIYLRPLDGGSRPGPIA